jgi:PPOX class probable FMN-dependent enzyme
LAWGGVRKTLATVRKGLLLTTVLSAKVPVQAPPLPSSQGGYKRMKVEDGHPEFLEILTTEDEIEAILGKPSSRVLAKVVDALDDICLAFIARSPFVAIASYDAAGRVDVSPKGDPPGFVHVLDRRTIAIPERPGNRRADTFRNVLQNPKVGLIFLVPGKGETLRVSGKARIVRDAWLRNQMAVGDRVPELALVVTVEEAFAHCTKCMVRSRMWQPETWNAEGLASIAEAMVVHGRLDISVAEMRSIAENDERTRLY